MRCFILLLVLASLALFADGCTEEKEIIGQTEHHAGMETKKANEGVFSEKSGALAQDTQEAYKLPSRSLGNTAKKLGAIFAISALVTDFQCNDSLTQNDAENSRPNQGEWRRIAGQISALQKNAPATLGARLDELTKEAIRNAPTLEALRDLGFSLRKESTRFSEILRERAEEFAWQQIGRADLTYEEVTSLWYELQHINYENAFFDEFLLQRIKERSRALIMRELERPDISIQEVHAIDAYFALSEDVRKVVRNWIDEANRQMLAQPDVPLNELLHLSDIPAVHIRISSAIERELERPEITLSEIEELRMYATLHARDDALAARIVEQMNNMIVRDSERSDITIKELGHLYERARGNARIEVAKAILERGEVPPEKQAPF